MGRARRLQHEPVREDGMVHGYRVVYERTPTGWSAYAPDLPGLGGGAGSREEMEQLMSEAIPFHLEGLRKDREERPWLYTPDRLSPELRAIFANMAE